MELISLTLLLIGIHTFQTEIITLSDMAIGNSINFKQNNDMNEKAEFAVRVLKQYALENQIPTRSTSDLSPMEEWLILRLFSVIKSLPDSEEIRTMARELDEKDFARWMYELQKGSIL